MRNRILICILVTGTLTAVFFGFKIKNAEAQPPTPNFERIRTPEPETALYIHPPVMQPDEFTALVPPVRPPQEIYLPCRLTQQVPVIDGNDDDATWKTIEPITTLDASSQRPIRLRCCHNGLSIFLVADYPDSAPSESHKSWFWDQNEGIYKPGNDREDMFVLKWLMSGNGLSFSPELVEPHTADIWFWKACRTNPAGYLDDKQQEVTTEKTENTVALPSSKYGTLYLRRIADAGKSACEEKIFFDHRGQVLLKFYPRRPEGSRADIRGKGHWNEDRWTIEIQRRLDTGHSDDLSLEPGRSYVLGVSLYEMAGTGIEENKEWFQPLYRTGNTYDRLILQIE